MPSEELQKKKATTKEKEPTPVQEVPPFDPVEEYKKRLKEALNQRYTALVKRLDKETNIINRYELKLSLECILEDYKVLFPEG